VNAIGQGSSSRLRSALLDCIGDSYFTDEGVAWRRDRTGTYPTARGSSAMLLEAGTYTIRFKYAPMSFS
jgi:hypothetical protein